MRGPPSRPQSWEYVGPDEEAETTDENARTRTVAEDVSGVPSCQPRSQENLRLRPQFIRIKILTDNRESRQMLQTLLWVIPLILTIDLLIVLSRYFKLWLRGYFTRARRAFRPGRRWRSSRPLLCPFDHADFVQLLQASQPPGFTDAAVRVSYFVNDTSNLRRNCLNK